MTRRQYRYRRLINAGFLPFEAKELSEVPLWVPYMQNLILNRQHETWMMVKRGWDEGKRAQAWKARYRGKGWVRHDHLDVGAMLRHFESRYKDSHPEWESPWRKHRRQLRDLGRFNRYYGGMTDLDIKIVKAQGYKG